MTIRRVAAFTGGCALGGWARHSQQAEKVHALSEQAFQKGQRYIDGKNYFHFRRAEGGSTPVFLPPDLPVVLKKSGDGSEERLVKMAQARSLCETLNTQCLVIPEARRHGEFLVEDRLPLMGVAPFSQMGLYLRNKEKFTRAIRELTAFLCVARMSDLVNTRDVFLRDAPAGVARFDNIPLYLEGGQGKIGLVDLEHLSHPGELYSWGWQQLITFFPYHFEDILEVVQHMLPNDQFPKEELEKSRDSALKTYEMGYIRHREYLDKHGITSATASDLPQVSQEQQEKVSSSVKKFMEEWYNYDSENDYFNYRHRPLSKEERQEMHALVDQTVPTAINLLQKRFGKVIAKCKESEEDLVDCRSFLMSFSSDDKTNCYLRSELRMDERNGGSYAEVILHHLLERMRETGIVYDYIPKAYGCRDGIRV